MALVDYAPSARDAQGRNRRFPTATEESFSAHDGEYATAKYIYKPICDEILALIIAMGGNLCAGGRLTLETGVPVSSTDQTAKTSVFYTPSSGNVIILYDGSNWVAYPFAEITKALGTLSNNSNYDLFAYAASGSITGATNATPVVITSNSHGLANGDLIVITSVGGNTAANGACKVANVTTNTFEIQDLNGTNIAGNGAYTSGGTWYVVKLEFSAAWSTGTARADALVRQDGVWVKSADKTRRYVGSIRTTSTTTTEDSLVKRFTYNFYNQAERPLYYHDATGSWTESTTANWVQKSASHQVEILNGAPAGAASGTVNLSYSINAVNGTAGAFCYITIGEDSTTAAHANAQPGHMRETTLEQIQAQLFCKPSVGYHYYAMLERVSGGTGTYQGNGGTSNGEIKSGLAGKWVC